VSCSIQADVFAVLCVHCSGLWNVSHVYTDRCVYDRLDKKVCICYNNDVACCHCSNESWELLTWPDSCSVCPLPICLWCQCNLTAVYSKGQDSWSPAVSITASTALWHAGAVLISMLIVLNQRYIW